MDNLMQQFQEFSALFPSLLIFAGNLFAGLAIFILGMSNIAAGIMLLVLRPLAVGEYVCLGNDAGTVTEVGLFATTLKTSEGLFIYIPNSKVWDSRIQNFGRHSIRKFTGWLIGENWGMQSSDLRLAIFEALGRANIDIPSVQRVVTLDKARHK